MEFNYAYQKDSLVDHSASSTSVSFAPDTYREPTFFRGELRQNVAFREGMSALHDVVVSDQRWQPKDRTEYMRWREEQDDIDWMDVAVRQKGNAEELKSVSDELHKLRRSRHQRMEPFYEARGRYFKYIYTRDKDAWYVLDPVITVHPDELFFECFSRDESSYGKLSVGYDVFQNVGDFACGTTNIDYSEALYDEFQKIRSYKTTAFEIDPGGFEVQTTGEASYKEIKIDMPESWVRGFLQVSSAMSLPCATFRLDPMDVHNMCHILRRRKELKGPRAMRYVLKPGQPIRIIFEPWETELVCRRSVYLGETEEEIRVWGRRRIHILERLIPVARSFTVQLLGKGMPSFYMADLGDMTFTLGLSGWTRNNWSDSGNFDLLAPRTAVDSVTSKRVFDALCETWYETPNSLANRLSLDRSVVLSALGGWTQAGRAIWDNNRGVYRVRELSREPLPLNKLRFSSEREEKASEYLQQKKVSVKSAFSTEEYLLYIEGKVKTEQKTYEPTLQVDSDERIITAACTCNWHQQNQLRKGPCEHILALRMKHVRDGRPSRLASLWT